MLGFRYEGLGGGGGGRRGEEKGRERACSKLSGLINNH